MKLPLSLSLLLLLLCHSPPLILAAPTSNSEQPKAQSVHQTGPDSYVVFHPPTSSCVIRQSFGESLTLGSCDHSDSWDYTPQKLLEVQGSYFCLEAVQSGERARLNIDCSVPDSSWDITADAKAQFVSEKPIGGGGSLCLDVDAASNNVVTNACLCSSGGGCDPGSQWFQFTTRSQVQG